MRRFKLSDLNLCQLSAPANLWQVNVKFAKNFFTKCTINLQELIDLKVVETKFTSIFLNFYENQANFLETIPVLIRNANEANQVNIQEQQSAS